ncbi:MAG TPA: D-alanine--D-alanine ligase [Labilithrix sp.]|jgi:D-alanine-D-alanine ligase|nr:D-alanine--D-alanine ligase [Labilithrix sp.]
MSTPQKNRRFSVAVVQGGPASEAEVSRASAASVARALEAAGHHAVRLELDAYLADGLRTGGYDVVFPVAHGAVGEDGSLQGLLEVLDLPYVGSGVLASALAMNKRTAKVLFAEAGLPVAPSVAAPRGVTGATDVAERAIVALGDKVVVKPCSNGSAIGVARLSEGATVADIAKAIEAAWAVDDTALVERFAAGREVTCGVLDAPFWRPDAPALPPTEIRAPADAFYTYQARYAPGRSQHFCPAPLGDDLSRRVQAIAVAAHRALGCRDLSRVDFVVPDAGEPTLLEVNTMPGFTETSLYPEAAAIAGVPMPELCSGLVHAAVERGPTRRNAALPLPK